MAFRRWMLLLAAIACGGLGQIIAAWGTTGASFLAALAVFALGGAALARLDESQPPRWTGAGSSRWDRRALALAVGGAVFGVLASLHTQEEFSLLQLIAYVAALALLVVSALRADRAAPAMVGGRIALGEWAVVAALTIVAFGDRLWHLGSLPKLIWDDEILYLFDALRLLDEGPRAPFASGEWGAPLLHAYSIAAATLAADDRIVALRLVSAIPGALTIPLLYLAVRELLGRRFAICAAVLATTAAWHLILSRQGYVWAINGFAESIVLLFLARGLRRGRALDFALAGFGLGLCFVYSYAAALMPLVLVLFVLWLLVVDRPLLRARFGGLAFLAFCAAVSVTPRVSAMLANPDMRGYQVGALVSQDSVGSPFAVIAEQGFQIAQSFHRRADNNELFVPAPNEPLLDPCTAAALGLGFFWALFSLRRAGSFLLLATFGVMLLPSAVGLSSTEWATAWRACGVVPGLFGLAGAPFAIAVASAATRPARGALVVAAAVVLALVAAINTHTYFVRHASKPQWAWGHNAAHMEAATRVLAAPAATRVLINYDLAFGAVRALAGGKRDFEMFTWPDDAILPELLTAEPVDTLLLGAAQLYWEDDLAPGTALASLLEHYYPGGRADIAVGADGHTLLAAFAVGADAIQDAHGLERTAGGVRGTLVVQRSRMCRFNLAGVEIDGADFKAGLLAAGLHEIEIAGSGAGLAWTCDADEETPVPESALLRRSLPSWGLRENIWRDGALLGERWVPALWFAAEMPARLPEGVDLEWSGEVRLPTAGQYTLMLMSRAAVKLTIDGEAVPLEGPAWPEWTRTQRELGAGWHSLTLAAGPPIEQHDLRFYWIDAGLQPGLFGGLDSRPGVRVEP